MTFKYPDQAQSHIEVIGWQSFLFCFVFLFFPDNGELVNCEEKFAECLDLQVLLITRPISLKEYLDTCVQCSNGTYYTAL